MSPKLVEVWRGSLVESVHNGDIVVVDKDFVRHKVGDPDKVTYWRSAAKPIQAVPVIVSGAAERFGFTDKEIAVMTGSHNGEEAHVETVASILHKIGLGQDALQCGTHDPYHEPSAKALTRAGKVPTTLHCNCSGKHSAMLALAVMRGYPLENYHRPEHPVQQEILDTICTFAEVTKDKILIGVDGCGVPVFGLPLRNMAKAWVKLADPSDLEPPTADAVRKITFCMVNYPHYVAGTDRLCTDLMKVAYPKVVAKLGAEGVYCIALLEQKLAITMKIEDGSKRALGPVAVETLRQLGALTDQEVENLKQHHLTETRNNRGEVVGSLKPTFTLEKGVDSN